MKTELYKYLTEQTAGLKVRSLYKEHLDKALKAFIKVGKKLKVIP